ncbi:MAG TPA: peptidoglycan editing factor PgeF [Clostridia bacterium]|nr:peptidoglycan editing factor PgeF [Clostridia bacterium]
MKTSQEIGNGTILVTDGELKYIEFECLKKYGDRLIHCFSTRDGGVSSGECSTLNLGFKRKDTRENILTNYGILCDSLGIDKDSLVLTNQVHDTKIVFVEEKDKGKGFSKESDIIGIDGLATVTPGVTLVTSHADCVPVFLFEPETRAAALIHSGWRGTLNNIASQAVKSLTGVPELRAERIIAVLGPSIGSCCFEVDEDVYSLFADKFDNAAFYRRAGEGKLKIDLQGIIRDELLSEGLASENIHNCGICTKCRRDLFFSYRGDSCRTGSLAAFMQIRA